MAKKLTTESFIERAKKVHGDKYDYSEVEYIKSSSKVKIICPVHGQFSQTPNSHLNNNGCKSCHFDSMREKYVIPSSAFVNEAKLMHGEKYDYSKVNYTNSKTKVEIICHKHGVFEQTPYNHKKGQGCPKCGTESAANKIRSNNNTFIQKSKNLHNDKYDYSSVDYHGNKSKVTIICPQHGPFKQIPNSHLLGKGCQKCSLKQTQMEKNIKNILSRHNIDHTENDRSLIAPLELDYFIPSKSLAIECDGIYWHSELINGDKNYHLNKTKLCSDKGVRLIHIFETELKLKSKIVANRLKNILGLNKYKIYARKCEVKEIDAKTKTKFLDKYHIQSNDKASVKLGLYYKTRLVAVMTFCRNRKAMGKTHVEGEWELSRFATIANFSITGGAGKLLKHFERNYKPAKITSYADRRWSEGCLYTKLGFDKIRESKPNYWYFKDVNKLYHRFNFRKSELSRKLETFDPNKTEWENMVENGWNRIWDCGNLVFEKKYER